MSTSKLGSFGALTVKKTADAPKDAAALPSSAPDQEKPQAKAKRTPSRPAAATNEQVKMTVTLTRQDWERIGEFRLSHRINFQQAAITGLNLFLKEMGQPPLQTPESTRKA
jgi:hypothetical protein